MRLNGSQEPRIWVQPTINHRITLMNVLIPGTLPYALQKMTPNMFAIALRYLQCY
jgi:hypothetical protein